MNLDFLQWFGLSLFFFCNALDIQLFNFYTAKWLMSRSIAWLTDLRTEDSGKLGCRLHVEDKHFELFEDFAVTGKCILLACHILQSV